MYRLFRTLTLTILPLLLCVDVQAADTAQPDAVLASGAKYYGPLKNKVLEGLGRLVWPNGDHYEGGFHNGLMSGKGVLVRGNNTRYEGEMADGLPNGQGSLTTAGGMHYEGHFANGYPDGKGRMQWEDGSVYEGDFRQGEPGGQGRLTRVDGSVYVGSMKNGLFDGQGDFREGSGASFKGTFSNGGIVSGVWEDGRHRRYEGGFKHWHFDGKGTYTDGDGNTFTGTFADGSLVKGRWHDDKGDHYEGAFKRMYFDGQGTYTTAAGDVYSGTFKDGELTGIGEYEGSDGEHYEGSFDSWRYSGLGRLKTTGGDVYVGQFKKGEYNGWGMLTEAPASKGAKPVVKTGKWIEGELEGHTWWDQSVKVASEALYSQGRLLASALKALQPPASDSINLYLVSVAGDGSEEVFRREAEYVNQEFSERFGTAGHSVVLANSRTSATRLPMATEESLRRTLTAVSQRMNPSRDILFLFLTSHGSRDHELSLREYGIDLANLKSATLGKMLKDLPFRYKVVVISACFSGGFINDLNDGHTLIITAARYDRTSFGCADENQFTYFGRAFFKESVPKTASFVDAFQMASGLVNQWENQGKMDHHSHPQIHREPSVETQLKRWRSQFKPLPSKKGMVAGNT